MFLHHFSMKSVNDFNFDNIWSSNDEAVANELVSFWAKHGILGADLSEHRSKQAVFVIRHDENAIVGVSTAVKIFHQPLRSYVYLYRCFIAPSARIAGLETMLTAKTKDYLESIHQEEEPIAVGFLLVAQSESLKKYNKAVWPGLNMMFIGNTATGDPIRICYFKKARI